MLSLLFAEHRIHVHFYDPSGQNVEKLNSFAKDSKPIMTVTNHSANLSALSERPRCSYSAFLSQKRRRSCKQQLHLFVTIPSGGVADSTVDSLEPSLDRGDIIMDASNEHWKATERRQKYLAPGYAHYIGIEVSRDYHSAHHGPSISPGGSRDALDAVFPFLQRIAAKDRKGRPYVAKQGSGGCGHYFKIVHNGIEHGMMTALCEA